MVASQTFGIDIVVAVVVVAIAVALFKAMWRVAEPNEALIISGFRARRASNAVGESMGFKIVTGHGTLVVPGIQVVRRLSLDLNEAELAVDCVTHRAYPSTSRPSSFTKWATTSLQSPTPRDVSSISKIRWTRASRTCLRAISARSAEA